MASTPGEEEFLAVIHKSQEAVIAVVRHLAETVRTAGGRKIGSDLRMPQRGGPR